MRSRSERKKIAVISAHPTSLRSRDSQKSPSLLDLDDLAKPDVNSTNADGKEIRIETSCKIKDKVFAVEANCDGSSMSNVNKCATNEITCNKDIETHMTDTIYEPCMTCNIVNDSLYKTKAVSGPNVVTGNVVDKSTTANIILKVLRSETRSLHIRPSDNTIFKDGKTIIENEYLIPVKEGNCLESDMPKIRKRKWISKKQVKTSIPVLSISTDSLKTIISDVEPAPLSDIKLDSSSEIEEVCTDIQLSDQSSSKYIKINTTFDKPMFAQHSFTVQKNTGNAAIKNCSPPSPSQNEESDILFITNLVRPFTVLQLKGLLARTGKIQLDGFWIDRIKSKCYVQYETIDEAIETRHALHGIRWPTSNPKCLNVDFGKKDDMQGAIMSTKDDIKLFYNHAMEFSNISTFFSKNNKKIKPVREWDLGKHNFDGLNIESSLKGRITIRNKEFVDKNLADDENYIEEVFERKRRGKSVSPERNLERKNIDPPLRLLDDLFRKTRTTPCIYWLPLTPEQIDEKYLFRNKSFNDHNRRFQQKDVGLLEVFTREKNGEYEKRERFKGSNECQKSRSKNRRRY